MDLSQTLQPKSDHLTADSLISGPKTIQITQVKDNRTRDSGRPVAIYYEGDDKPYLPSLGMRRAISVAWGTDSKAFIGRGVTVYRDPTVMWAGIQQGGIRISHLSHISKEIVFPLAINNKKKILHTIKPLLPWPPENNLVANAYQKCVSAGLTEPGVGAFCRKLSDGKIETLDKLNEETLKTICKNGISHTTVAECNTIK